MKQSRIIALITGSLFIILGLLLLGSVVGIFESSTIYRWVLPLVFIVSGIAALQENNKSRKSLGYGLVGTGVVGLCVMLGILDGALVNALLGAVLISAGSVMLARNWQLPKKVSE